MNRPTLTFNNHSVGDRPLVVGTICSDSFLRETSPATFSCDWVELRFDELGGLPGSWGDRAAAIRAAGFPMIGTIRLAAEGGQWKGSDAERLAHYREILPSIDCIDVELQSPLVQELSSVVKAQDRGLIISYHNFQETPSFEALRDHQQRAEQGGGLVKIVTMIRQPGDLEILERVLDAPRTRPLCLMGMGALGSASRVPLARRGSALVYGYLDRAAAPGQKSAAELKRELADGSDHSGWRPDYSG